MKLNWATLRSLESREESILMRRKFNGPFLYSSYRWEKNFFTLQFFHQSDFEEKSNSFNRLFCRGSRAKSEQWCWKSYIHLPCILQMRVKKFFFISEFLNQWDFEKKSNWINRLFCHWNRGMSRQWCWKNSIDLCCILQIGEKIFFFLQNFSANRISKKNGTQLFDYFVIGIERWVNSDAEKILFAFVVFSKSGRKIFFSMKIFQPIRFREKIELNFSIIFSLESSDESTVTLKKFYWPLLYSPNRGEKVFFYENFLNRQISRKNPIQLFDYFVIRIERWVNSDAEKILLTFLVFFKSVRKNFSTSEISRKNQILLFDYFVVGVVRRVNSDVGKVTFTFLVFSKCGWKNFFLYQNFWTNEISRKNQIELIDYFVIGIEVWVDSDAEKIPLTFVVFSKSGRKYFFFFKIFQPIRFRKKLELSYSIILSLESRA